MYYIYIDEAGRGPIAGPVYVGMIIIAVKKNNKSWGNDLQALPGMGEECYTSYDDSKIIAEVKREELYEKLIRDKLISFASGSSTSTEVDTHGIVRGIRTAIARALRKYFNQDTYSHKKFLVRIQQHAHEFVLVIDGKTDFHIRKLWGVPVEPIVDGDAKVPMIGAASIVAKVERDRMMRKYHKRFPLYGFDMHKGYGTKDHYALIRKHGLCKEHRKKWIRL